MSASSSIETFSSRSVLGWSIVSSVTCCVASENSFHRLGFSFLEPDVLNNVSHVMASIQFGQISILLLAVELQHFSES